MAAKKKMDGSAEETTALSASGDADDRKNSIRWEGDPNVEGKSTIKT